jgi:S1/P1 nuclease
VKFVTQECETRSYPETSHSWRHCPYKVAAQISDPEAWIKESAELAKQFAYVPPVSTGTNAVLLTREYETNARNIARSQAALAAARLANLINNALK